MNFRIHPRRLRLVYSPYTFDQLEYECEKGKEHIGRFEFEYGYPTDIDKVWEQRNKIQDDIVKAFAVPRSML